jgi:hypothetical protein
MAQMLPKSQILVLIVTGVLGAWLWVSLFSLWAVYDTPLLKLGFAVGLGVSPTSFLSLTLFALVSTAFFTLPLWLLFKRRLVVAASVFGAAFVLTFVVPVAFDGNRIALLASLTGMWLFLLCFGVCVTIISRFRHA